MGHNNFDGRRRGVNIANILAVAIFGLAIVAAIFFAALFFLPDLVPGLSGPLFQVGDAPPTPTLLARAQPPALPTTDAPSGAEPTRSGAAGGVAPTWTPPATATAHALPTNTRRPTPTPSITPTFPPPTLTRTPTPTPTLTPSPGPSPTVTHTRSPFPFTKTDDSPFTLRNYANSAGCDWLGIAGEVYDLAGNPVPVGSYRVHVWGDGGIDMRLTVGSAPAYGPAGWEQFIFNAPVVRNYNVQLETPNGTAVSQVYQVQTRASCNENLLILHFTQNH